MEEKKLSVIILTYNSESHIDSCLQSIFINNDLGNDLEIIIVDNNSLEQDKLNAYINEEYPQVHYIQNKENSGYGAGNNIGIRASRSKYVLIMNPDVQLREFSFKEVYEQFESEPKLGVLGFIQYESLNQQGSSFVMLKPSLTSFFLSKFYYRYNLFNPDLYCFHGSCFSFRKTAFEDLGYFDESIFLYGEERYLHTYLMQKKQYYPKLDRKQSYIHPTHGRTLHENQAELGLKSYLNTLQKFGLNQKAAIKSQIRFEQFFMYKSLIRKQKERADFYRNKISRLKEFL